MKKLWLFVLTFTILSSLSAQIGEYTKDDILTCLEIVLAHPIMQDALQRDINHQDEFTITIRDDYVRSNPLRVLLQKIDQMDISRLNNQLYLNRTEINRGWRERTDDPERRNINCILHYDKIDDVFEFQISTERLLKPRYTIRYLGSLTFARFGEEWEVTVDRLNKIQQR